MGLAPLLIGFLLFIGFGGFIAIIVYLIVKRVQDKEREKNEFEDRPW